VKIVRTIFSITLAVLVLFASSSFYFSTHVCGGEVKAVAFLHIADGCGHTQLPPCHKAMAKSCCEDNVISHEAQDVKKESSLETRVILPSFELTVTPAIFALIVPETRHHSNNYLHYDTPLLGTDRTVVLCSFLI